MSLVIVCSLIIVSIMPAFANTSNKNIIETKISNELEKALNKIEDNDKLDVSLWFEDIDRSVIKNNVQQKLQDDIDNNIVSQSALDLAMCNDDSENSLWDNIKKGQNTSSDEVNKVIATERKVSATMYKEENYKKYLNLFSDKSESSLAQNKSNLPKLIYSCHYAPNIDIELTKAQINQIVQSNSVKSINYINNVKLINDDMNLNTDDDDDNYDTSYFNVTGLSQARDIWGLNGNGMKVGIIEASSNASPATLNNSSVTIVYGNDSNFMDLHGTLVACIMVGNMPNYKGAIPNAALYSACITHESEIKVAAEELLDNGVTAINCSYSYPSNSQNPNYNTYGDTSQWYDYISKNHNVSLILSSGNNGSLGVKPSNMAYNAIVVGNCDNTGCISSSSSYSTATNTAYKPDIVAPGQSINTPVYGSSGTSFSAPMVTSAVIQLSQSNSAFLAKPSLIKSILLSSAKITNSMNQSEMISNTQNNNMAMSRQYGVGLLNITNAYVASHDYSYYKTSSFSPNSMLANYNKTIYHASNKTIRVCLTWDKIIENNNNVLFSNPLDNLKLTVTTPSGVQYSSMYMYDNKQVISFVATESGMYNFKIARASTQNSNHIINYSLAYSVQ